MMKVASSGKCGYAKLQEKEDSSKRKSSENGDGGDAEQKSQVREKGKNNADSLRTIQSRPRVRSRMRISSSGKHGFEKLQPKIQQQPLRMRMFSSGKDGFKKLQPQMVEREQDRKGTQMESPSSSQAEPFPEMSEGNIDDGAQVERFYERKVNCKRMLKPSSGKQGFRKLPAQETIREEEKERFYERKVNPRRMLKPSSGKHGFRKLPTQETRRNNRERTPRESSSSSKSETFPELSEESDDDDDEWDDTQLKSIHKKEVGPSRIEVDQSRMLMFSSGKEGFRKVKSSFIGSKQERKGTLFECLTSSEDEFSEEIVESDDEVIQESGDSFNKNRKLVMKMLKREQELRMCEETQKEYDEKYCGGLMVPSSSIEDRLQKQVLTEFGVEPNEKNLRSYRCINGLYSHDPEVCDLIVYMKHDISREGDLRIGYEWPDVELMTMNKVSIKLSELYKDRNKPLAIFGASRS